MSKDRWYVSDLETDPFAYGLAVKPFLSGCFDGSTFVYWWGPDCIEQLLSYLKNRRGIVYFHNGGKFDIHHLLPLMKTKDLHDNPILIGGRIVELKWRQIVFRDSYALVPKPLRSWAKDDIDYKKLAPHRREANREEIIKYFKGDHYHLRDMLQAMFDRYGRSLTLASLTFKIMAKDFGIPIVHTTRGFDRHFRLHYFAGRVQFWKLGRIDGPLQILDINSAFPRAMEEKHWWGGGFVTKYDSQKVRGCGLYEIQCAEPKGCFAWRGKEGIEFPEVSGPEHECYFTTGWEILAAREVGVKGIKILTGYLPKKLVSFRDYVRHFYALKEQARDPADRYFAKLILNSFYGKLAQNSENFSETRIMPWAVWPDGKGWELVAADKAAGRWIFRRPAQREGKPYCVATAASITGWVRAQLVRAIHSPGGGVVYCDTDSLALAKPGAALKIGSGLGEWKREMRVDYLWIAGKKLYAAHSSDFTWHRTKAAALRRYELVTFVEGLGWTAGEKVKGAWKTAHKGVQLSVTEIIAVSTGKRRTAKQMAPSYGLGRGPLFITRTIKRADMR